MKTSLKAGQETNLQPTGNGAKNLIDLTKPYRAKIQIVGTAPMLMHGWNIEAIAEKTNAKKGSDVKKTDDVESYVYRDEKKRIVMPAKNLCAGLRDAGKSFLDPASARKSMRDRIRAVVVPDEIWGIVNGGTATWDFIDRQRVTVNHAGITRSRPAFNQGWTIDFVLMVLAPEYVNPEKLYEILEHAGKFGGIGDFRPTYGRFRIGKYEVETI